MSLFTRSLLALRRAHTAPRDLNLNGVFVPLTTPFKDNQDIAYDRLKENLDKYEQIPFAGYVVAGSNGEAPYLSGEERVNLVKFVRENTSKSKMVIGGSTAESTRVACDLTVAMGKVGADGVLVMPPFYFRKRMTEEAIVTHYNKVAEEGGLPIVIYNMPMVTGIDIGTHTLAKLAKHPLIRGVKDSDIRKCAVTVLETKNQNFDVLIGSAGYLLGALMSGCSGGINGLAGALGKEVCSVYHLFKEGKLKEAMDLQIQISKPDALLLSEMGVPGLKVAMDLLGLQGGICRHPILPPSDLDRQKIKHTLQQYGFLS